MTAAEVEAETERAFLKQQWDADQKHGATAQEAIREAKHEQNAMEARRKHKETTGKRPYGGRRFIPLAGAQRLGYIGQGSKRIDWRSHDMSAVWSKAFGSTSFAHFACLTIKCRGL